MAISVQEFQELLYQPTAIPSLTRVDESEDVIIWSINIRIPVGYDIEGLPPRGTAVTLPQQNEPSAFLSKRKILSYKNNQKRYNDKDNGEANYEVQVQFYELKPGVGTTPTATQMEIGGSGGQSSDATKSQFRMRQFISRNAVSFDGVNDYAPLGFLPTDSTTVEMTFIPTSGSSEAFFGNASLEIGNDSGSGIFYYRGGVSSTFIYTADTVQTWRVVCAGTTATLYVDNIQKAQITGASAAFSANPPFIGSLGDGGTGSGFAAMDLLELTYDNGTDSLHYTCLEDTVSATQILDVSGNDNHSTVSGATLISGGLVPVLGDAHPVVTTAYLVQIQNSDKYPGLIYSVLQYTGYQSWTPI